MARSDTDMLTTATYLLSDLGVRLVRHSESSPLKLTPSSDIVDAVRVRLEARGASEEYLAVTSRNPTLSGLPLVDRSPNLRLLVIGERIESRTADALRAADIEYVDARGNAFIRFGGVHIEIQGRRAAEHADSRPTTRHEPVRTANLFSTRRAQVVMCLLAWPKLWTAKIRDVATAAGVSTGLAHDSLAALDHAGFGSHLAVDRRTRILLLDLWTGAYATGLGPKLALDDLHGEPGRPPVGASMWHSGEVADGVDLARPTAATYYVDELDPRLTIANRWRRDPDYPPNIHLRRKFWTLPPDWMIDRLDEQHPRNAPWPLVYADLRTTNDSRLTKVAEHWREPRV